jgi:hypothetical protein
MADVEVKERSNKSIIEGISLSAAFLLIGIFVYCTPNYLGGDTATSVVSGICFFIAFMGFTSEISKSVENANNLFSGILAGVFLISIWAVLYHYFPIWWVNLITLFILLIGVYGMIISIIEICSYIKMGNRGNVFVRVVIVGSEIIAFVASIITILQSAGVKFSFFW